MSSVSKHLEDWLGIEKLLDPNGNSNVSTLQQVKDLINNIKWYEVQQEKDHRAVDALIQDKLELQKKVDDLEFRGNNGAQSIRNLTRQVEELTDTLTTIEKMVTKYYPNDPCGVLLLVANICDSRNWYKAEYEELQRIVQAISYSVGPGNEQIPLEMRVNNILCFSKQKEENLKCTVAELIAIKDKTRQSLDTICDDVEVCHLVLDRCGIENKLDNLSDRLKELVRTRNLETTNSVNPQNLENRVAKLESVLGVIFPGKNWGNKENEE